MTDIRRHAVSRSDDFRTAWSLSLIAGRCPDHPYSIEFVTYFLEEPAIQIGCFQGDQYWNAVRMFHALKECLIANEERHAPIYKLDLEATMIHISECPECLAKFFTHPD